MYTLGGEAVDGKHERFEKTTPLSLEAIPWTGPSSRMRRDVRRMWCRKGGESKCHANSNLRRVMALARTVFNFL